MPGSPVRAIVEGGLVLLGNEAFEEVSLVIEGGAIAGIARETVTDEDAERIDARGRLVVPGLVNAHTHSHGALGRGAVEDRVGLEGFLAGAPAVNGGRTGDDLYLSAALSAVELIRKGCTACYDLCVEVPRTTVEGLHRVGQAYADAGMRAVVAPMIADRTLYQALPGLLETFPEPLRSDLAALALPPWEETIAACAQAARTWPFPRDRVRPGIGPTIPLHCSDPFLAACGRLAEDLDLPMQTHLAETKTQGAMAQARYGASLAAHLERLDLLRPRLSAAHGVWLDADDRARLADAGVGVSHNPMSNLRLGSGVADVGALVEAGVRVGIGTDASNTSDGQNMFEALRLASYLSRVRSFDTERWIEAAAAFRMATEGSAALLGLPGIGRIAPGARADLVFLDRDYCHYVPLRAPLRQIVFSETGAGVREVMVDGRFVLREGRILTLDEGALVRAAHAAAARLDAANAPAARKAQAASAVIRGFCLGQCRAGPPMGRMIAEELA